MLEMVGVVRGELLLLLLLTLLVRSIVRRGWTPTAAVRPLTPRLRHGQRLLLLVLVLVLVRLLLLLTHQVEEQALLVLLLRLLGMVGVVHRTH